jgi:Tfp pilus assembly protein PilF
MGSGGNQPNREELLQMGIRAAKAGNKEAARLTFQQILGQDKRNERAMMWMAQLADTRAERKKWLNRALMVNPDNETARKQLNKMNHSEAAKQNRVLLVFGVIVGVMIVLGIVVVLALTLPK